MYFWLMFMWKCENWRITPKRRKSFMLRRQRSCRLGFAPKGLQYSMWIFSLNYKMSFWLKSKMWSFVFIVFSHIFLRIELNCWIIIHPQHSFESDIPEKDGEDALCPGWIHQDGAEPDGNRHQWALVTLPSGFGAQRQISGLVLFLLSALLQDFLSAS